LSKKQFFINNIKQGGFIIMENLFANTGIGKHIIRTHHWGIVLHWKKQKLL